MTSIHTDGSQYALLTIGHAETPWSRGACPKNMRAARDSGQAAALVVGTAFQAGLTGIERATHLILVGWFADAERDVLVQHPRHLPAAQGCFALRTPVRPNPIGVSIVRLTGVDTARGRLMLDALDWFDGTPLLDIKPYYPSTDMIADAQVVEP